MNILHTYNDGSRLIILSARTLIAIPIWKGNRIIDTNHIEAIRKSIGSVIQTLDSGFRIICYKEEDADGNSITQQYIIDGQHRCSVLRDHFTMNLCETDFTVTATEITVKSEADAIAYFNRINNVKPIQFKEDPKLVVNRYIEQICRSFPAPKKGSQLIRSVTTRRPYLHIDQLRDALAANYEMVTSQEPDEFAACVKEKNTRLLRAMELALATGATTEQAMMERCIEMQFALAFDPKMKWVRELRN